MYSWYIELWSSAPGSRSPRHEHHETIMCAVGRGSSWTERRGIRGDTFTRTNIYLFCVPFVGMSWWVRFLPMALCCVVAVNVSPLTAAGDLPTACDSPMLFTTLDRESYLVAAAASAVKQLSVHQLAFFGNACTLLGARAHLSVTCCLDILYQKKTMMWGREVVDGEDMIQMVELEENSVVWRGGFEPRSHHQSI